MLILSSMHCHLFQALLSYIAPFHWPHQYVPLLFSDRIDFVACPGIFLMGCHAMHKEKIKEVCRNVDSYQRHCEASERVLNS